MIKKQLTSVAWFKMPCLWICTICKLKRLKCKMSKFFGYIVECSDPRFSLLTHSSGSWPGCWRTARLPSVVLQLPPRDLPVCGRTSAPLRAASLLHPGSAPPSCSGSGSCFGSARWSWCCRPAAPPAGGEINIRVTNIVAFIIYLLKQYSTRKSIGFSDIQYSSMTAGVMSLLYNRSIINIQLIWKLTEHFFLPVSYLTLIRIEVLALFGLVIRDALQWASVPPRLPVIVTQDTENPVALDGAVTTHHQTTCCWTKTFLQKHIVNVIRWFRHGSVGSVPVSQIEGGVA